MAPPQMQTLWLRTHWGAKVRYDAVFIVNRFVDVVFMIDMALNFFTAFPVYTRFGRTLEFRRKKIARNYLTASPTQLNRAVSGIVLCVFAASHASGHVGVRTTFNTTGWFIVDFLSILPFDIYSLVPLIAFHNESTWWLSKRHSLIALAVVVQSDVSRKKFRCENVLPASSSSSSFAVAVRS
eukprot:555286-Amphidinium_carterae.1